MVFSDAAMVILEPNTSQALHSASIYSEFRLSLLYLLYIRISMEQQQQLLGREPMGSRFRDLIPLFLTPPFHVTVQIQVGCAIQVSGMIPLNKGKSFLVSLYD